MDDELNSEINRLEFDMNAHDINGNLKMDFVVMKNSEHVGKLIESMKILDESITRQRTIVLANHKHIEYLTIQYMKLKKQLKWLIIVTSGLAISLIAHIFLK